MNIDVNARLESLLEMRGWTEYRLSKKSGLAESTIANIFRRNCMPSISTLDIVCSTLGITLSQFFSEGNMVEMTPEINELFENWSLLTPEQKKAFLQLLVAINQDNSSRP